ncbi:cache domain-containing sensor histidine kinase [Clostridium thermarum]|uniref:cache domain-containing sensor histidine kinase n=1 Tax=Clostridium thermarum TaxID=1716543 RepID=UPI0011249E91|nr:sensor histidine kinase [Clostridium thermarum]
MDNTNDKFSLKNFIREKMNDLRNLKLVKKLIYSYIVIITIPTIAFSLLTIRGFENNLKKDAISENRYQLEAEKASINRNFQALVKMSQMVITDDKFMAYMKSSDEYNIDELVEFNQDTLNNILRMQYSNPSIKSINFFSSNKNVMEIWPLIFKDYRANDKYWYKKTMEANGKFYLDLSVNYDDIIFDTFRNANGDGEPVVGFCRAIIENRNIGVIRVNMPSKVFFTKMFSENEKTEGQFYVIDKSNNIYTNENSKFLKENFLPSHFLLQEYLKNKKENSDNFTLTYNKKDMIVIYTEIEELGLDILNVVSMDELIHYTKQMKIVYILGSVIIIAILSIVIYFITSILLKRLYVIIQSMKRMQQGDFNIDIPIRGSDEIGELAHHFRKTLKKINELIQDAVDKRSVTKEAELRALHNQIDSHFIYNTLENIKMMAEIDEQYMIADSIYSLGAMMRYNMKWNSEFSTLHEEIAHIQNYITLMNVRFDNKINLILEIEENLLEHEILKMSLQPIVENSVKHGLKNMMDDEKFNICVKAYLQGIFFKVSVTDNGVGIPKDEVEKLNKKISNFKKSDNDEVNENKKKASTGIGLKNVNERIKLFYGDEYGIEILSEVDSYTSVIVTLPY